MKRFFIFAAVFLLVAAATAEDAPASSSLGDQIIQMKQIILAVEYHGGRLNVWKDADHGRYYVTPLCEMEPTSVKCDVDEYSEPKRFTFTFKVQLWNTLAAQTIQLALQKKGIDAAVNDIHPLPMQYVRLSINREDVTPVLKIDNRWHSHQGQPNYIWMNVGVNNEEFCNNMTRQAKADPAAFLSKTKLNFEFTMSTIQEVYKILNITGNTVSKTEFFTELDNNYNKGDGNVYLNSADFNRLAKDIYRTVKINDYETAGYIKSDEEAQIINSLLDGIKGKEIDAADLSMNEWDSVFWDDIYARPDIQTEYFNETLTYDSKKDHFKYDETKENEFRKKIENRYEKVENNKGKAGGGFSFLGFKLGGSGGKEVGKSDAKEDVNNEETKDKNILSKDELKEFLTKTGASVKWTGTKFEMKDLKLQRINTKALQSKGEIYFKRVVASNNVTTQQLPILPSPTSDPHYDKPPIYYEMLQKTVESLSAALKADIANLNEKYANLEGGHESTKSRLSTLIECSHAAGACAHLPIAP